ncbi:MAG: ABC transporter ATP-binding protein [Alphaproteobacteria bacterium]
MPQAENNQKIMLEVKGVHAGYGGADILHGVNVHVAMGEIVVLVGPNGAGKSTVMKAVFGLLNISSGTVTLDGIEITNTPPQQVVGKGVSFVPQSANVFPTLSVEENLEMGAFIRKDDFKGRIAEIYEMFPPLYDKRKLEAGSLSGGQRQMVAMGKALMIDPKILLVDEPTAGLSPKYQEEILEIVKRVNSFNVPIMMVEQNVKQALQIADRGYVLVDGCNRIEDTGPGLLANAEIAEMFLGG